LAVCIAVVIAGSEARAGECTPPTPACHLANGKELLDHDPERAAAELLASFQLDERTDTLALYAIALQLGGQYAHALETWKRVIVFRDSELDAAKLITRTATGRKLAKARAAVARAQKQSEQAAEAIIKLWPSVGRVRIRIAAGQQLAVSHDGAEVDVSRDVLVNAGHDELVFTRKDGSVERVAVEVAAGASAKLDAPPELIAKAASPEPRKVEPPKPANPAKPAAPKPPVTAIAAPAAPPAAAEPSPPVTAAAKPAAPAPKLAPAAPPEAEPAPVLSTTRVAEQPRSRTMSRVGLGLVAGGIIAGGIAGGLGYLSSRDFDRARDNGCSAEGQCPFGPAADLAARSNDRARLAQISAIGGGALLATGAVLWILGRGKPHRAASEITLHVGSSSTAIGWRF
jgi:hypothetical protein